MTEAEGRAEGPADYAKVVAYDSDVEVPQRIYCKDHGVWKMPWEACPGYGTTLIKDYPPLYNTPKKP